MAATGDIPNNIVLAASQSVRRKADDSVFEAYTPLTSVTPHAILSTTHSDTTAAAVVRGDLITGQGASPAWARLALTVPAAGTLNYLGINNGETEPSWKSASSAPAAAAILQSDTAGGLSVKRLGVNRAIPGTDGYLDISDRYLIGGTQVLRVVTTGIIVGNSTATASGGANVLIGGNNTAPSLGSGSQNVCLGNGAGFSLTTTSNNMFIGTNAGRNNTASSNVAIGTTALYSNVGGANNIAIGFQAGYNSLGASGIYIGNNAGYYDTAANRLYIGNTQGSDSTDGLNLIFLYGELDASLMMHTGVTTTNNAALEVFRLQARVSTASTGGAAGFGPAMNFYGESATDASYRAMAQIDATWATATDASRKARLTLSAYDTAAREGLRIEASGTAPLIGFMGATAIARYSSTGDLRQCLIDFGLYTTGGASPLDLNGGLLTSGSAHIGGVSDYANVATDGTLTLLGTAKVLKEIQIETSAAAHGGAAPTNAQRAVGASGGVLLDVDQFSKTSQNDVFFDFHAPNDLDNTVNVAFHLMWLPGSGWTTGNYLWKLEYLVKSEGDAYNTVAPTTIQEDVTPANATAIIETHFATTINLDRDQILIGHFYRDVAGDNADDTGDTIFFEIEYTSDRLGE